MRRKEIHHEFCSSGKVKSCEGYPKRVARLGLNRAYMKIRTPNSCCTDVALFFEHFYRCLHFVGWLISGHF